MPAQRISLQICFQYCGGGNSSVYMQRAWHVYVDPVNQPTNESTNARTKGIYAAQTGVQQFAYFLSQTKFWGLVYRTVYTPYRLDDCRLSHTPLFISLSHTQIQIQMHKIFWILLKWGSTQATKQVHFK